MDSSTEEDVDIPFRSAHDPKRSAKRPPPRKRSSSTDTEIEPDTSPEHRNTAPRPDTPRKFKFSNKQGYLVVLPAGQQGWFISTVDNFRYFKLEGGGGRYVRVHTSWSGSALVQPKRKKGSPKNESVPRE